MPKKDSRFSNIKPTKVKTIILSLVIAIVLCAFVIYLIQAIHPSPRYEDYCKVNQPYYENITKEICEAGNGTWIPQNIPASKVAPSSPMSTQGYCDYYAVCQKSYDDVRNQYNLIVFMVAVIVGLIAVSLGIILNLTSVSSGLMLGGAFLVFYGTAIYWTNLSRWLKVIILGIVLLILIWIGYKKLKN